MSAFPFSSTFDLQPLTFDLQPLTSNLQPHPFLRASFPLSASLLASSTTLPRIPCLPRAISRNLSSPQPLSGAIPRARPPLAPRPSPARTVVVSVRHRDIDLRGRRQDRTTRIPTDNRSPIHHPYSIPHGGPAVPYAFIPKSFPTEIPREPLPLFGSLLVPLLLSSTTSSSSSSPRTESDGRLSQTMTAVENLSPPAPQPPPPPPAPADDDQLYHSDDVGLRDTPPLEKKVRLQPSPSPPLDIPSPEFTPDSSPDLPDRDRDRDLDRKLPPRDPNRHRHRHRRHPRNRACRGDAVLVYSMDGGKRHDIADIAGREALQSDDEDPDNITQRGATAIDDVEKDVKDDGSLAAIAAGALAHQGQAAHEAATQMSQGNAAARRVEGGLMGDVKPSIPASASAYAGDAQSPDVSIKPEAMAASTGGLPPIRQHSPISHLSNGNGNGPITLPSITAQLGDINHLADNPVDSPFPQSPPARPPHSRYPAAPNHGSPPKSPNDAFHRRGLPSPSGPGHYYYTQNNHQRIAQADGTQYASAGDYSSSNAETPSTEHSAATPALPIDRMSIDGITNPQIGGYQCSYPGCTAQPFQTQVSCGDGGKKHLSNANSIYTVPVELPRQRALVDSAALLPCQGLPTERRGQGLQEEERDDPARAGARFARLRVPLLPRQGTQVPAPGQSPAVCCSVWEGVSCSELTSV